MKSFLLGVIAGSLLAMSFTVPQALNNVADEIHQLNVDDGEADDDELTTWVEPYGGCKEAYLFPESSGYAECVEHGLLP